MPSAGSIRIFTICGIAKLALVTALLPLVWSVASGASSTTITAGETAYARGIELSESDPNAAIASFETSASAYAQALAESKGDGAALHFNRANSLLRAGVLGEAIVEYRAASLRAPSDERVQTNLTEARRLVERAPAPPSPSLLERACTLWSFTSEHARWTATIALLWLGCALSLLFPLQRTSRLACYALALLIGTTVALDVLRRTTDSSVVLIEATALRKGNGEGFELTLAEPLPEGTECHLIESRPGWNEIALEDGTNGWIRESAVMRVP